MRILALDVGTHRIGVAYGSSINRVAVPIDTIVRESDIKDFEKIEFWIKEKEIDKVLIGMPLLLSGLEGKSAKYAKEFGNSVEKLFNITVVYWDERFSTHSAQQVLIQGDVSRQKRKHVIDKLAATIFLQSYLDSL
ncbi:Holliday junction resolvase RuvX [bacterium]|nr:Holliday junction resolvase RuvX [bacterium]